MKKIDLLLLLAAGCAKHDPAAAEVEVQTQGRNRDCGNAQVLVLDPAKVAELVGTGTSSSSIYLALKLDTALWQRQNQTLLLRIRRPTIEEQSFVCTAMGPVYPAFTVVSTRVK